MSGGFANYILLFYIIWKNYESCLITYIGKFKTSTCKWEIDGEVEMHIKARRVLN